MDLDLGWNWELIMGFMILHLALPATLFWIGWNAVVADIFDLPNICWIQGFITAACICTIGRLARGYCEKWLQ